MSNYINPANAVTASRFLTLPPFIYFVSQGFGYYQWATVCVFICAVFDKVDGLVAKIFNCQSDFGAVLDAIADGVCYGVIVLTLAIYGWVPWVPVVIFLTFGVANIVFRFRYSLRVGKTVNFRSFAMERVVGFFAFLGGFATIRYEVDFYFYACAVFYVVVVIHDAKRMLLDPVPQ